MFLNAPLKVVCLATIKRIVGTPNDVEAIHGIMPFDSSLRSSLRESDSDNGYSSEQVPVYRGTSRTAAGPGFEPEYTASKTVVLPLDDPAINVQ